jgi:hypothetical protein
VEGNLLPRRWATSVCIYFLKYSLIYIFENFVFKKYIFKILPVSQLLFGFCIAFTSGPGLSEMWNRQGRLRKTLETRGRGGGRECPTKETSISRADPRPSHYAPLPSLSLNRDFFYFDLFLIKIQEINPIKTFFFKSGPFQSCQTCWRDS